MKNYEILFCVGPLICQMLAVGYFDRRPMPNVGDVLFDHSKKALGVVKEIISPCDDEAGKIFIETDLHKRDDILAAHALESAAAHSEGW